MKTNTARMGSPTFRCRIALGLAAASAFSLRAAPATATTPSAAILTADLRAHVAVLAGDDFEGRLSGSPGARKAADYIADQLQRAGVKPLGENGTYFQNFEFSAGVETVAQENRLTLTRTGSGPASAASPHAPAKSSPLSPATGSASSSTSAAASSSTAPVTQDFSSEKDFRPLSFTVNGTVTGEVVFMGYGLTAPGQRGDGYDSYAGVGSSSSSASAAGTLDVKDKIVVALRYVPEGVEPARRAELNRYAGLRYKALVARAHGARALLIVTGPNSPNPGELAPLSYDSSTAGSGIVAGTISGRVADALLAGSGRTLKQLQDALDLENPHAADVRFTVPQVTLSLTTKVNRVNKTDRNVLGVIPPANGSREYVMLGAHFDHLGRGEIGGFGIKGEEGRIHHGADDNASGVSAVLELAADLAARGTARTGGAPVRGVVLAFWSGEEVGLLGSSHFAEKPTLPLADVAAYLNFDMVGRLRENQLTLQGLGSSPAWKALVEKANAESALRLTLQDDPYLPTDTTALYPKNIPVLAFFTGSHEQYHRPSDTPDTLNYDGLEQVTRLAGRLTRALLTADARPEYKKVEQHNQGGARDGLRAYLGTIPDYAAQVAGLRITGTRAGSPADKGGIKGGDIVVEFGGQKITNIYDYTYALEAAKIGVPTQLIVERDGKKVELTVTLEARK